MLVIKRIVQQRLAEVEKNLSSDKLLLPRISCTVNLSFSCLREAKNITVTADIFVWNDLAQSMSAQIYRVTTKAYIYVMKYTKIQEIITFAWPLYYDTEH
jgi:hypothetical protein